MRGSNIRSFLIIGILAALTVGGAYMFMSGKIDVDDVFDKKEQVDTNDKGEVKFLNSKRDGAVITQTYKANINAKEISIDVIYTYENIPLSEEEKVQEGFSREERITGKLGDIVLFESFERTNNTSQRAQSFDTQKIDKEYNLNYFKVIRGTDGKDYLAIATHIHDGAHQSNVNYLYVFDDEMKVISNVFDDKLTCSKEKTTFMIHPGSVGIVVSDDAWYENQFKYDNSGRLFTSLRVEDNKIYYLLHNVAISSSGEFGTLEERIYTINANKLEYETVRSYKATSIFGQTC